MISELFDQKHTSMACKTILTRNEHKNKDIVVCLCFGGDIQEQVRPRVEGYTKQHETDNLTFEEWNGDKLADLIQSNFLREDLLPANARSQLRKSLALLDEPDASYQHFSTLIRLLSGSKATEDKARITAWTPTKRRGRPSQATKPLVARWCQ